MHSLTRYFNANALRVRILSLFSFYLSKFFRSRSLSLMIILLWKVYQASKGTYTLVNVDIRNSSGHESDIWFGLVQRCVLKPS